MKSWIYAGVSDKNDFLLYVCRLLSSGGSKVLLIDGTERQVYRYSIGQPDKALPITEYCGFDVACGFFSAASLKQYLQEQQTSLEQYDLVIYDLEKMTFCDEAEWGSATGIYWTSSLDRFSVERSGEWFKLLFSKYPNLKGISMGIILNRFVECLIEESYIKSLMELLPVKWGEQTVKLPWDEKNYSLQLENEHNRTIQLKKLSRRYKKAIVYLVNQMLGTPEASTRSLLRSSIRGQVWANS